MNKNFLEMLRIGIFYDGYYFYKVSNFYKYEHERKSRISISGLHEFIRYEVSLLAGTDIRQCQIVDAHYFKGRSSARELGDKVQSERIFEDILMRENIVSHYLPLRYGENNVAQEKGIDVWLALEAYELSIYKHFDIVVLVAGDGDYVPLVRKLHTLGTQVMLVGWDFSYHNENGDPVETKTSRALIDEVFYPVPMHQRIEQNDNEYIKNLFVIDRYSERNQGQFEFRDPSSMAPISSIAHIDASAHVIDAPAPVEITGLPDGEAAVPENIGNGEYVSTIFTLNSNGFGFIKDEEKNNIFFHYSTLTNREFNDLRAGMRVSYSVEEDVERSKREESPRFRAIRVTVLPD